MKVHFCLLFSSAKELNDIRLAIHKNGFHLLLEAEEKIYFLSIKDGLLCVIDKDIPIIGFYFLENRLLILEEAGFYLLDLFGKTIEKKQLDLIENFEINKSQLHITTYDEGAFTFKLA
ncbi:MAG: hypothetical protein AAF960_27835 [Bacteroidota bacterium]